MFVEDGVSEDVIVYGYGSRPEAEAEIAKIKVVE